MSWFVYILWSDKKPRTYVGFSENPQKRLVQHNNGEVTSTKNFRPWKIFYTEKFEDYKEARKKEIYFKTSAGRRKIAKLLQELNS